MKHAIVLLMVAALPATLSAQTVEPEMRTAQRVYDRLAKQFNDGRPALPLVLTPRRGSVAFYMPADNAIYIEAAALKTFAGLGPDSLNALSYVLAHELAHYYSNHADRQAFGNFFAPLATVQKSAADTAWKTRNALYQKWQMETEADFRAGFSSYLAGFKPLAAAPRILDYIYKSYGMDPTGMRSHPPLSDRLEIVKLTETALADLIAMFEGATQLMVMGRYPEAGRVYQHIAGTFPSREILSNAGTAKLMEAIALLGDSVKFAYPVELDTRTRMRGMGFGDDPDDQPRWYMLLTEAQQFFQQAKLRDPNYVTADVNLAIVYSLMEKRALASATAEEAQQLAEKRGETVTAAHARIVRAIVLAETGKAAEAEAEFKRARAAAPELADRNLAILKGGTAQAAPLNTRIRKPELIGGIARRDFAKMNEGNVTKLQLPAVGQVPELQLYIKQFGEGVTGFVAANDKSIDMIIAADSTYKGASAEGIRVGSTTEDVKAKYGNPDNVLATSRGAYLVYSSDRMAFSVDAAGRVTGWMIYGEG